MNGGLRGATFSLSHGQTSVMRFVFFCAFGWGLRGSGAEGHERMAMYVRNKWICPF